MRANNPFSFHNKNFNINIIKYLKIREKVSWLDYEYFHFTGK